MSDPFGPDGPPEQPPAGAGWPPPPPPPGLPPVGGPGYGPPPGQVPPGGPGYGPPPGQGWPAGGPGYPPGPKPANYLVWAILATLFCCLPFGVVSIVYAAQVDSKWNTGDWSGAQQSSGKARTWALASAIVGGAVVVIYIAAIILGVANSDTGTSY